MNSYDYTEEVKHNIFREYFSREINILYLIGSVSTFVGFLIDLLFSENSSLPVTTINVASAIMVLSCILLKYFKVVSIQTSYTIMTFLTFLAFYLIYAFKITNSESIAIIFIRDLVVYPLFIISLGFIAGKKKVYYLGIPIVILFVLITIYSQDKILIENSVFIGVMISLTTLGIVLFLSSMEKALIVNRNQRELILSQNLDLEKLNNELEESNSAKNKLISIIGHDLRGPIGSIGNMLRFLKDDDLDDSEYLEILSTIEGATDSTYGLLLNLLCWARSEQGELAYAPQKSNISSLIEEVIDISVLSASLKSISLLNTQKDDLYVLCDIDMVKTILRNLISNAIKFTKTGGKVTISIKRLNEEVIVTVTDTGIGIKPEIINQILSDEKVFSSTGTYKEEGTGIGLELCKTLAIQNKGKLSIESELNVGSKFSFNLPIFKE